MAAPLLSFQRAASSVSSWLKPEQATPKQRIAPPVETPAAAPEARATTPEKPMRGGIILQRPTVADIWINEAKALSVSVVWGCVMAIAEGIGASEWTTYRFKDKRQREYEYGPLYDLLNFQPNPEQTPIDFRISLLASALLSHGAYAEIVRDGRQRPVELWPLHPSRVCRDRDDNGNLIFRVTNFGQEETIIPARDMFWIRGRSTDGETPIAVIEYAREVLARAIAMRDFGSAFFGNGATFGGVFFPKEKGAVTEEQAKRFTEFINEEHAGAAQAHATFLVPYALDYKQLGVEPDHAQFVESEQHLVEEICRYFRVPPHKVQHLIRATFNNIEHLGIEFVRDAVTPWAERMRQEANIKLNQPTLIRSSMRIHTRFDLDWLREGDAKSVAEADSTRVNSGLNNHNEIRNKRGENNIGPQGDQHLTNAGNTTLDRVGEQNAQKTVSSQPQGPGDRTESQ